jgi:molybdopterin-binding protein
MPKFFMPGAAAQVLQVSRGKVKRWIYENKIRSVKTAGGHHRIPEEEVYGLLYPASEREDVSEPRTNFQRISACSQLSGHVTDIRVSGLMAQVTIYVGGQRITSVITADAVRGMRLETGQTVSVLLTSTEVMIMRL